MGPMPWTINAEIYPLWARGAGNGAATFFNWLFNLCISISFLSLTETIGAHGMQDLINTLDYSMVQYSVIDWLRYYFRI